MRPIAGTVIRCYADRMSLARPLLVRLIAVAFAIVGASGTASLAPQALRAWVDAAAEVAQPRATAPRSARAARPISRQPMAAAPARPRLLPRLPVLDPARLGTRAWPAARGGRGILALKRSRLV